MKIGIIQMRVVPGKPEYNLKTMRSFIDKAKIDGCRIVVFPEMCIGGYLLGDRWTEECWCDYLMECNEELRMLSDDTVIIYGNVFVDKNNVNKDGRVRKYNAGYVFHNRQYVKRNAGTPNGIAVKTLLPNYRIFDDERYFFSSQELAHDLGVSMERLFTPFDIEIDGERCRFGVQVCEDLWFKDYRYKGKPLNVTKMLIENGAQYIFNLSASPWTYGKGNARNNRIRDAFTECDTFVPFFYVNSVGVQNNGKNIVTFDGDSTIYNERAEVITTVEAPYAEEMLTYETNKEYKSFIKTPIPKIAWKYRVALEGIRGLDELMGNSEFPYIIGMSGGVDSAVVASLVHKSVGPQRIVAFNLPSRYNSEQTKGFAAHVAEKLGIEFISIPIEQMVQVNSELLQRFTPSEFHMENIQAKIRGTSILSNVAGIYNGVMTNNGNKVEIALGYATLYGDVNGAIAPIGDLLKVEVFELARYLNEHIFGDEVIPNALIPDEDFNFGLPPTAELKQKQVDPMKWGYHDALVSLFTDYRKIGPEKILEWYIEGTLCENLGISETLYYKYELDNPDVFVSDLEWLVQSIQRAVFKRIQAPPIIIMSKGSYGYDIRESQLGSYDTNLFRSLKEKIRNREVTDGL